MSRPTGTPNDTFRGLLPSETRLCRKCDKPFLSYSPFNKLCPGCNRENMDTSRVPEADKPRRVIHKNVDNQNHG